MLTRVFGVRVRLPLPWVRICLYKIGFASFMELPTTLYLILLEYELVTFEQTRFSSFVLSEPRVR